MNVTLSLNPETEKSLTARAKARGLSLDEYLRELVAREAGISVASQSAPIHERFNNLSDLLLNSPLAGASLDLQRHPSVVVRGSIQSLFPSSRL